MKIKFVQGGGILTFFKPEDIADILQIDVSMVFELLEKKKLVGIKINDIWRIKKEHFERFIDEYSSQVVTSHGKTKMRNTEGRYSKLYNYLMQAINNVLELTFEDIEKINGRTLPQSARKYRPWWGNDYTHSQALAWLNAGYKVGFMDLETGIVRFIKDET